MYGLGGQVIFLSARDTQLARSEPLKDMARVMSRYVDAHGGPDLRPGRGGGTGGL